jgi:hypothetical protein
VKKKIKRKSIPSSDHSNKLSAEHKAVVIKLLGSFETPSKVAAYIFEKYNIGVSVQNVSAYANRYPDEIKSVREKFLSDMELLPIVSKGYRIKIRQNLVFDIMGNPNKDFADDKLWLEEANTAGVVIRRRGNHSIVNDLLDSVRDELEPRRVALTNPNGDQDSIREAAEVLAATMAKVTEINENIKLTSG